MDPRSLSASILQRGAGQRGRHGAPGAETGRGDGGGEEKKSPERQARAGREAPRGRPPTRGEAGASPGCLKARGPRCNYSPAIERKRGRSGRPPERGPAGRGWEGKGPGGEAGRGGQAPHAVREGSCRPQSLVPGGGSLGRPRALTSARGAGKGDPRRRGGGALSPASQGRPWRPRPPPPSRQPPPARARGRAALPPTAAAATAAASHGAGNPPPAPRPRLAASPHRRPPNRRRPPQVSRVPSGRPAPRR